MKWKKKSGSVDFLKAMSLVFLVLGVGLFAYSFIKEKKEEPVILNRPGVGQGEVKKVLSLNVFGKNGEILVKNKNIVIDVPEVELSKEEKKGYLDEAKQEISDTFIGENRSIDEITSDVVMADSYASGRVLAEWCLDNYTYIDIGGKYLSDEAKKLKESGCTVKAAVNLNCQGEEEEYEFYFNILPPSLSGNELIVENVSATVEKMVAEKKEIYLPQEWGAYRLKWKDETDDKASLSGTMTLLLSVICLILSKKNNLKEEKIRIEKLQKDYPELVGTYALLMGAGMTAKGATEKIVSNYDKAGNVKNPLYRELKVMVTEISNGVSESKAFFNLAERCKIKEYRKFCSLMSGKIKMGSYGLLEGLQREADSAYEIRKNSAKKQSEEAATKMVIPMFMMLGVVLVITVLPAFMTMNS